MERLRHSVLQQLLEYRPDQVFLLEPPTGLEARRLRALRARGVEVRQPEFFAGHVIGESGESAWIAASRSALATAPVIAARIIQRRSALADIQAGHQKKALQLHLAKSLLPQLHSLGLRIEVGRWLAAPARPTLWVDLPALVPADALREVAPDLDVRPVRTFRAFLAAFRPLVTEAIQTVRGHLTPARSGLARDKRVILTVHEEDLEPDRSLRGQLHWRGNDEDAADTRIVILPQPGKRLESASAEYRESIGVTLLNAGDVRACLERSTSALNRTLVRRALACMRDALFARRTDARAAASQALVFVRSAQRIAAVAEAFSARTWVSCEPYFVEADAVNHVARDCGIRTIAWQYSTVAHPTFLMVTQADVTATFSSDFTEQFRAPFTGPDCVVPLGFPFDDVPGLVRGRSETARADLQSLGVQFVIGFFDEGVGSGRWFGLYNAADHRAMIEQLAQAVLDDPTLGVVVKPKYAHHDYRRIHPGSATIAAAFATGRFRQLSRGEHRNLIFAAEAAIVSDVVIGLLAGGTAAVEGALAGARSLLVRTRGDRSRIEPLLDGLDAIYPSIPDALQAIRRFRNGDPGKRSLGDWSSVASRFNAGGDGRTSERLRHLIEGKSRAESGSIS